MRIIYAHYFNYIISFFNDGQQFISAMTAAKEVDPATIPGQVYQLHPTLLYVVAEAENLGAVDLQTPDGDNKTWWTSQNEDSPGASGYWSNDGVKYLGEGFVKYTGASRQGGSFLEDEDPYSKQGPKEHWRL